MIPSSSDSSLNEPPLRLPQSAYISSTSTSATKVSGSGDILSEIAVDNSNLGTNEHFKPPFVIAVAGGAAAGKKRACEMIMERLKDSDAKKGDQVINCCDMIALTLSY